MKHPLPFLLKHSLAPPASPFIVINSTVPGWKNPKPVSFYRSFLYSHKALTRRAYKYKMNFTMNATTGAWLCISNTAHCHIAPHFVPLACHISMNSHISGMGGSTKGLLHRPTTVHALNSTVSPAEGDLTSSNSGPAEFKPRVGMASQQGPREEMEDMTQVIDAQCGFLFASRSQIIGHGQILTACTFC